MLKYGIDTFKFEVIIICFDEDLHAMEREYIRRYNSIAPNGYNILEGGQCGGGFKGKKHSPDTVQKIKQSLRVAYSNPDLIARLAENARISNAQRDIGCLVKSSEKFKTAMTEGRVGSAGWKTVSSESKKKEVYNKVSASLKKYYELKGSDMITHVNTEKHRAVMAAAVGSRVESYKDGTLVKTYCSIADAARDIGVNGNAIQRALKDSSRFTCRGMSWKYSPDCEDA